MYKVCNSSDRAVCSFDTLIAALDFIVANARVYFYIAPMDGEANA